MNRIFPFIILIFVTVFSFGQKFTILDIDFFRPKNVKSITIYNKSFDTVKHFTNNHQLLERKIEYYKNGIMKSDLRMNYFSDNPLDTCPLTFYKLNKDSTIKSEKFYYTSERKWENGGIYKYKNGSKYPYEIFYSKKDKSVFEYDINGRLIREKNIYTGHNDYVYDSLGRLVQRTFFPRTFYDRQGKRCKSQTFFVFKYHYNFNSDSLFCIEDEYIFWVNEKNWDKIRSEPPKYFDLKDMNFKVELRLNYKIIVFNNRYEIIGDYNCWRYEIENHPYSKNWTRRTYAYEYY